MTLHDPAADEVIDGPAGGGQRQRPWLRKGNRTEPNTVNSTLGLGCACERPRGQGCSSAPLEFARSCPMWIEAAWIEDGCAGAASVPPCAPVAIV